MDKLKMYVGLTALGCVLVLVAGWFILVSPKRAHAAELNAQTATQVSANSQLQTQLQVLKAKAKDLPKKQARLASISTLIPDNPALPGLIRGLSAAADAAGVELVSVTPGTPVPVTATAATATTPARPGAPAAAPAAGLSSIPLTLNVVGRYFAVEQFLSNLETLPRALRVSNLSMSPGTNPVKPGSADPQSLTTTITGSVYMAGAAAPAAAVVAPPVAAPAAGVQAPATAGTTSAPTGSSTVVTGPAPAAGTGAVVKAPTSSTQENS